MPAAGGNDQDTLLIGGEWVAPDAGHYDVLDPATEEVVGRAPEASVAQALEAARAAKAAQPGWAATPAAARGEILRKAAGILFSASDLPALAAAEAGCSPQVAQLMHVWASAARLGRYADGALEPTERALLPMPMPDTVLGTAGVYGAMEVRHPVGVVTCITSYNNPLANTAGKVAPALAMGNTVVVKPAPQDPLAVYRFAAALQEAGAPPGVVNVVTGSGTEVGQACVDAPEVDMVSFTGSTSVGSRIGEVCARHMKRQLMELGGKGAAVVLEDADLDLAARAISTVWTFYAGQICTAPTRVVVHRQVHDALVARLTGIAEGLRVGHPASAEVGPVISATQRERVETLIAKGVDEGATLAAGGHRPDLDRGFFVAPTLFTGCTADMAIVREEFFGPVVVVVPADDEEHAVALANDSDYGLLDYVFSADAQRAHRVARRLEAGGVGVNTVVQHQEAAFGGFKRSGVGRDRGSTALLAYSETQSIVWPS